MTPFISQINIYPLKSAAPISLDSALLTSAGLEHDRRLMLIDEAGVCITAREFPELLHVHTQINSQQFQFSYKNYSVSLNFDTCKNEKIKVNIHGSISMATLVSPDLDVWFSGALGIQCRLVTMQDADVREVEAECNGHDGDVVSFADEHALLLISEASLEALNQRLDKPVSMKNFRPNLVVAGTRAFAEDDWQRIRIGGNAFRIAQTCQRCKLTTIDPETAEVREDNEPLKTMLTFRRNASGRGVIFGVHMAPVGKSGLLCLNDEVLIEK